MAFSGQSPYSFRIQFNNTQFNNVMMDVYCKIERQPALVPSEYEALVKAFGDGGGPDDYWLWYRVASLNDSLLPLERYWGTAIEPWVDIANGNLVSRIVTAFERIRAVLTECGVS
jgi:hypothetical protein